MKNIECFNLMASHVLLALSNEFPKPMILDSKTFQENISNLPENCRWESLVYGNLAACTIKYLIDEGYVRAGGRGKVFDNAVLTAKGFSALNRRLDALETGKTIAERLREVGMAIAPEIAGAVMSRFLQVQ